MGHGMDGWMCVCKCVCMYSTHAGSWAYVCTYVYIGMYVGNEAGAGIDV